jgi:hypothetical protein
MITMVWPCKKMNRTRIPRRPFFFYETTPQALPGVIDFVCRHLFCCNMSPRTWSLKVPMVEAMQEHLGQIIHCLPFLKKKIL